MREETRTQTDRQSDLQKTKRQIGKYSQTKTDRQAERQTDELTGGQRKTNRQTGKKRTSKQIEGEDKTLIAKSHTECEHYSVSQCSPQQFFDKLLANKQAVCLFIVSCFGMDARFEKEGKVGIIFNDLII